LGLVESAAVVAKLVFPSVVLIETKDASGKPLSLGSGFFVTPNIVATNLHVLDGAGTATVKIVSKKGVFNVSGVVGFDAERDLALLKVEGVSGQPLKLSTVPRKSGERIFAVGNPKGLEGSISEGIVSSSQLRTIGGSRLLQITAPISQGSSGGPVVDLKGEVVGIATAYIEQGQNLNFATPSVFLASLTADASDSAASSLSSLPRKRTRPSSSEKTPEQILKELQDWVLSRLNNRAATFNNQVKGGVNRYSGTAMFQFRFFECGMSIGIDSSTTTLSLLGTKFSQSSWSDYWSISGIDLKDIVGLDIYDSAQNSPTWQHSGANILVGFVFKKPYNQFLEQKYNMEEPKYYSRETATTIRQRIPEDVDPKELRDVFLAMARVCRGEPL